MRNLFLALLVAMVAPAFAQEMTYTDPTQIPIADQTYTVIQQQTATPIEEIKNTGGTALTLYDDGVSNSITLPFDFYYYGNLYDSIFVSQNGFISFTSQGNGCCSGNPLPSITEWNEQIAPSFQYMNLNNSIFAMWSDLADFNNPGNPYYQAFNDRFVVGWYGINELGSEPYNCDAQGCFPAGPGNKFTYEITLFANNDFMINYGAFDYNNQTGRTFTSGYQGDQAGESYQIYNGNDPTSLQNTTYLVQSSEVTPPPPPPPPPPPEEPDPPIAPDCTVNPTDPTCIINSIVDDEEVYFADENSGSDDGSEYAPEDEEQDSVSEEEIFVADETLTEEVFDEEAETLEEMLADESEDDAVDDEETLVAKEINDEQKSNALADSIATNVLEAALAVAADATSAAGGAGGAGESSSQSSSSSNKETMMAGSVSEAAQESSSVSSSTSDSTDSNSFDLSSGDAALDILETGRAMGQEALAATMQQTESSATESLNQAESVAATSVTETESSIQSITVADSSQSDMIEDSQQQMNQQTQEAVDDTTVLETMVVDSSQQDVQAVEEQAPIEQNIEQVMVAEVEQQTEVVVAQQESESSVEFTDMSSVMENFVAATDPQAAEQQELENNIIQQAIASAQQNEDDNKMGFAEAEAVTIVNDPALANAFNVQPNTASLELLGVLGSAGQDKSDAELRAEQVVAANKEEQDAINANYMEADQSGILAAIGSETDVSAYRTAMLRDNNVWYKPEDIYKGVIIKDNVRGSYFLEKGNTDTYKKMVEEQYKDE